MSGMMDTIFVGCNRWDLKEIWPLLIVLVGVIHLSLVPLHSHYYLHLLHFLIRTPLHSHDALATFL